MDAFELYRRGEQKLKLFVLYWRRIVFARDHFKVPFSSRSMVRI